MSYPKELLCLAVSWKHEAWCVAGKDMLDDAHPWVRPVMPFGGGEIPEHFLRLTDGSSLGLLDTFRVTLIGPSRHAYQCENHVIDTTRKWVRVVGSTTSIDLEPLLDRPEYLWPEGRASFHGANDRFPVEAIDEVQASLYLIRPACTMFRVVRDYHGHKQARVRFVYDDITYQLKITDPPTHGAITRHAEGWQSNEYDDVVLCLSLSEPFEGHCYKLCAGVFNLDPAIVKP